MQMQQGMQGSGLTGGLPPIEQQRFGNLGPGVQDLSALRTPHGGIRTAKKTKQQKKEDMHNKKRSRKVLNKQLMSMDFGQMAPPESESSDDDMFTGIFLEPLPDHFGLTGPPSVPSKGRRSGPKYQLSTERETLTTSEDDSSAPVDNTNRPYIRISSPQSGGKSGGETNRGFVADEKPSFTVEKEKAEKKEEKKEKAEVKEEKAEMAEKKEEKKEETKDEDPPPPAEE